jgi:hypothetical protein
MADNNKLTRVLMLCTLLFLTACSSVTVRPYGGEKVTTEPDYKESKDYYLGWLLGEHTVNVSDICGERRVMQMQAVSSLYDMVVSFASILIYTPRTAKVWCEHPYGEEASGG